MTADEANAARAVVTKAHEHIRGVVVPGTVLALPTSPCIAPLADGSAGEMDKFRTRVMRLTCTAGVAGLPQINLPDRHDRRLPGRASPSSAGRAATRRCSILPVRSAGIAAWPLRPSVL